MLSLRPQGRLFSLFSPFDCFGTHLYLYFKVDIKCVCEGGCNQCEWKVVSNQKILGVDEELPSVSHANGFMQDYTFVPAVKHKWEMLLP